MSTGHSHASRRIHNAHSSYPRNGSGNSEPSKQTYSPLTGHRRIVILTEGCSTPAMAKTAISLLRYRSDEIVAVWDAAHAGKSADEVFGVGGQIPVVDSIDETLRPDALYIGLAFAGGTFPSQYRPLVLEALDKGIDIVSGLHDFLSADAELATKAEKNDCRLFDVRQNLHRQVATGAIFNSECFRVHTVGQDCSVGKMTAALELEHNLLRNGHDARFLATGQTGIMLRGAGVPVDCVVADFVNGAVEDLVLRNQNHDFLLIEGQGSITHPAFSAVNLGLLHGCAPDALILCYEVGRETVKGLDHVPVTPLEQLIQLYEANANLRNPCKVVGIAMNSGHVSLVRAEEEKQRLESSLGVPVCDVFRQGCGELIDAIVTARRETIRCLEPIANGHDALQSSEVSV